MQIFCACVLFLRHCQASTSAFRTHPLPPMARLSAQTYIDFLQSTHNFIWLLKNFTFKTRVVSPLWIRWKKSLKDRSEKIIKWNEDFPTLFYKLDREGMFMLKKNFLNFTTIRTSDDSWFWLWKVSRNVLVSLCHWCECDFIRFPFILCSRIFLGNFYPLLSLHPALFVDE